MEFYIYLQKMLETVSYYGCSNIPGFIDTKEAQSFKSYLETDSHDWIVKGFVDVDKNVYTISIDTKVVSKIIEILLIPKLDIFANEHNLVLELPSMQNYYPDLTFKDEDGNCFAVDFKSSYYAGKTANGLTLGSYWGYFRNRDRIMNMDRPYNSYKCHLVLGMLYKQREIAADERTIYSIDELRSIKSVINDFIFFVQPKWKIALARPGSGNTRNIGGTNNIDKLINGQGSFASLGEEVFDHYWMNYYNTADAKLILGHRPFYNSIKTYKEYLQKQASLLDNMNE